MPETPPSIRIPPADQDQWPARNMRNLCIVVVIDLCICVLFPLAFLHASLDLPWAIACMALHIPTLAAMGYSWRRHKPSQLRLAAIVSIGVCHAASLISLLLIWIVGPPILGLWFAFTVAAPPVMFDLLLLNRKPPPGRCIKCDYSLKGLTTTTCPECGTIQPTDSATPDAAAHRGNEPH